GWPRMTGNWKIKGDEIEISLTGATKDCDGVARYRTRIKGKHVAFDLISDDCVPRSMILDRSTWVPTEEVRTIAARHTVSKSTSRPDTTRRPTSPVGSWPSFRGPQASGIAEHQILPDRWGGKTGENILWHTPIPGLAHSSPIVWGDRI